MKFFSDPFHFDKIGSVAAEIITQRTQDGNGQSKGQVTFTIEWYTFKVIAWLFAPYEIELNTCLRI